MKIEKIIVENLTSFQGKAVVDFTEEPLRSAHLFAITGNTGAGKTTLLDAICLALYNRAPRLESAHSVLKATLEEATGEKQAIQPNQPAIFLRKGEKSGGATIVFTVQDGSRWEATWSIRLKRTGTYDRPVRTLRCLSPRKEDIPAGEIETTVRQVVGLDYEQFTRTVLLAQNSFASFLRAKDEEKSVLLEKLTGTEIYTQLSIQIFQLAKDARSQVETVENKWTEAGRDIIPAEELVRVQTEYDLLTTKLRHLREEEKVVAASLQWYADNERAEAAVREAEIAADQAVKALTARREEEKELELYDSVRPIQNTHQRIAHLTLSIRQNNEKERQQAQLWEEAKTQHEAALTARQRAEEALSECKSLRDDRLPLINEGIELLHKIKAQQAYADNVEKLCNGFKEERAAGEDRLNEQQALLKETTELLEKSLQERTRLQRHQPIFESFRLVVDKLSQLEQDVKQDDDDAKKLESINQKASEWRALADRQKNDWDKAQGQLTTLRHEIDLHQRTIDKLNGVRLQSEQTRLTRRITLLKGAETLWERLSKLYSQLSALSAEKRKHRTELLQTEKELEKAAATVAKKEERYATIHTSYTLSRSQDIVELRQGLQHGQPCPVCGSAHHPYHTETEQHLGQLMTNLANEYEAVQEQLKAAHAEYNEVRQHHTELTHRLAAVERHMTDMERQQGEWEEEWRQYAELDASFRECSAGVNQQVRKTLILTLLDATQRDINLTETDLGEYNRVREHIDQLQQREQAVRSAFETLTKEQGQAKHQYELLQVKAEELTIARQLRERSMATVYQDLDNLMTLSNWYKAWTASPAAFNEELSDLYHQWKSIVRAIEQYEHNTAELQEQIKSLTTIVERIRYNEQEQQTLLEQSRKQIERLHEDFRRSFPDHLPEVEMKRLNDRVEAAEQGLHQAQKEVEMRAKDFNALEGKQREIQQQRLAQQQELQQANLALSQWLSAYNGEHEVLLPQQLDTLFSDGRNWTALRSQLEALRIAIAQQKTRLEAAQQQLIALQRHADRPSKEDSRAALAARSEQLVTETKELYDRHVALSHRLSSHRQSLARSQTVWEEVEAARENAHHWAALSAVFGSAEGKKFRDLAQSFTFSTLVEQANYHLATLSPRYTLRTLPGTLALEIIDRDLLDTRRYVSSLSGGETFLVSLALALGLASLSSHNLRIGSLFIDEGFGNLDAASLDLVMTALSNLQSLQGRKVGIISHTDQIRSQISPQICVLKRSAHQSSVVEVR